MRQKKIYNQLRKSPWQGFTLVELLIVIAITAILATISFPIYTSYVDRAKFSEVVSAAQPYKLGAELAVQVQGATITELDAGNFDIPSAILNNQNYGKHLGTIDMLDGRITATAKNLVDDNDLPIEYILQAQITPEGRITWQIDPASTCLNNKLC